MKKGDLDAALDEFRKAVASKNRVSTPIESYRAVRALNSVALFKAKLFDDAFEGNDF